MCNDGQHDKVFFSSPLLICTLLALLHCLPHPPPPPPPPIILCAGKSYTVVGTPSEPGLLPRALDVIFSSLDLKQMEDVRLVPERFSELRRIRDDQEFEERQKWKERLLSMVSWFIGRGGGGGEGI